MIRWISVSFLVRESQALAAGPGLLQCAGGEPAQASGELKWMWLILI